MVAGGVLPDYQGSGRHPQGRPSTQPRHTVTRPLRPQVLILSVSTSNSANGPSAASSAARGSGTLARSAMQKRGNWPAHRLITEELRGERGHIAL